jgi:hypothetical protein
VEVEADAEPDIVVGDLWRGLMGYGVLRLRWLF